MYFKAPLPLIREAEPRGRHSQSETGNEALLHEFWFKTHALLPTLPQPLLEAR